MERHAIKYISHQYLTVNNLEFNIQHFVNTADWMNQNLVTDTYGIDNNGSNVEQWLNVINGYARAVYCTVLSDLGHIEQYNMLASPEPGQGFVTQVFDLSKTLIQPGHGSYHDTTLWDSLPL